MSKTALISVWDKTGIVEFASMLCESTWYAIFSLESKPINIFRVALIK